LQLVARQQISQQDTSRLSIQRVTILS